MCCSRATLGGTTTMGSATRRQVLSTTRFNAEPRSFESTTHRIRTACSTYSIIACAAETTSTLLLAESSRNCNGLHSTKLSLTAPREHRSGNLQRMMVERNRILFWHVLAMFRLLKLVPHPGCCKSTCLASSYGSGVYW